MVLQSPGFVLRGLGISMELRRHRCQAKLTEPLHVCMYECMYAGRQAGRYVCIHTHVHLSRCVLKLNFVFSGIRVLGLVSVSCWYVGLRQETMKNRQGPKGELAS